MESDPRHFLELLVAMTQKELRARYKYTIFGFLWLVVNPLLQMTVIYFIFSLFMKEPIAHYEYYLFIGLLAWNFFSLSLSKTTPSIVHDRSLIKKANFPRAVIPLSIVGSNFIHFLLALPLVIVPTLVLGTLKPAGVPVILTALVLLLVFSAGISLLTSALNVRFRDVNFLVSALLIIWFYATPIVYSLAIIPVEIRPLWRMNPLVSVVQFLQSGFLGSAPPDSMTVLANTAIIILIAAAGWLVFRSESRNFDDWV